MKLHRLLMLAGLLVAGYAGPALAQDAGDKVRIHYHRPDGSYDGWGLHTWESFQAKDQAHDEWAKKEMSDRPLDGVTWFKPMPPSGKDDFGVFWEIPAKEYGNGRVNYIIHKGDKKDQCNKDMFFTTKDTKDAWVVATDCKVYMTKEDALKSPKLK
jgi:hypothetical protein